jgi:hypothetical protein
MFVEVREPHTGKLLFKFDPDRLLIEHVDRGLRTLVDLTQYAPRVAREGAMQVYINSSSGIGEINLVTNSA